MSTTSFDLVVVGGGLVGLQAALLARLTHAGWRIAVLDQGPPPMAPTLLSAGVYVPGGLSAEQVNLDRAGDPVRRLWRRLRILPEPVWLPAIYVDSGERSPTAATRLGAHATPAAASEAVRHAALRSLERVWITRTARRYDLVDHVRRLAAAVRRLGVTKLPPARVVAVDSRAKGLRARLVDGSHIEAARLLAAPGPWVTEAPWQPFAERHGLRVKRVVAFEVEPARRGEPLVVLWNDDAFWIPALDRNIGLLSIRSPHWIEGPSGLDPTPTSTELVLAREILGERFGHARLRLRAARVSCDAYTEHSCPLVGPLDDDARVQIVAGFSGSGVRLSPGILAGHPWLNATSG